MAKAKRRLKKVRPRLISLCPAGANQAEVIFKDDQGNEYERVEAVAKMDAEGYLNVLIYMPEEVSGPDTEGDVASALVVKDACHNFIPNMTGSGIDIMHDCEPVSTDDAHICENFMISKRGDSRFDGAVVNGRVFEDSADLAGSWAQVIKLDHPGLKALYEEHGWAGVSMYGPAIVEDIAAKTPDVPFSEAFAKRLGSTKMTPEEIAALAAKTAGEVVAKMLEANAPAPASAPAPAPAPVAETTTTAVKFEGDMNSLEDIAKHEEALFRASLDMGEPADVAKWRAYVEKRDASGNADEGNDDAEVTAAKTELAKAKARVAELEKSSKQPAGDVSGTSTDVSKDDVRARAREAARSLIKEQGGRVKNA